MEYNTEIEEGRINVPKSLNISNRFFIDKVPKCRHFRQNSLNLSKLKASPSLYESDFKNKDILNGTVKDKYKNYLKTEDNNSTTTKTSVNDKLKKVTFSTVEIIRVANYKKYNKLNSIKKIGSEENKTYDNICSIF